MEQNAYNNQSAPHNSMNQQGYNPINSYGNQSSGNRPSRIYAPYTTSIN